MCVWHLEPQNDFVEQLTLCSPVYANSVLLTFHINSISIWLVENLAVREASIDSMALKI